MRLQSLAIISVLALACASHDGPAGSGPEEAAAPAAQLRATIASVQLLEDCPDPEPAPAKRAAAKPSEEWVPHAKEARRSCAQSTMQLALAHDGRDAQRIEIVAVRLVLAGGDEVLSTVASRGPSKWNDAGAYEAWDERVPVGAEIKVSYKISPPNWAEVQQKLVGKRGDTFDQRYIVEVDLKMGGTTTTVRSAELARERPHVMVT
jgi:hypothetical protein